MMDFFDAANSSSHDKRQVITIDRYTSTWDDAIHSKSRNPVVEGMKIRFSIGSSPDGRELDAFRRRMHEEGLELEYIDSDEHWEYWELVRDREKDIERAELNDLENE